MAQTVDIQGVDELLARGAQLVEVLPREEYDELHLPGATNLPLKELDSERAGQLDRERPVIVYCWDALCDMSPRAATRLAELGFEAYDYDLSKVDWMAHGRPMEGEAADRPTALTYVRHDVATCRIDDHAEDVRRQIESSPYGFALALADGVVLGRVRRSRLEGVPGDTCVERLMELGPSTTRPHTDPDELAGKLRRSGSSTAILTTPEAVLIGVVRTADLHR
ncbi:MAG TPA: rhodanese-like domain-containing protein [Solirubrobacteraceae bacterium]|nr:rhodanese-like domain-containing protein [Solirubrobacteraceae bacterium]